MGYLLVCHPVLKYLLNKLKKNKNCLRTYLAFSVLCIPLYGSIFSSGMIFLLSIEYYIYIVVLV